MTKQPKHKHRILVVKNGKSKQDSQELHASDHHSEHLLLWHFLRLQHLSGLAFLQNLLTLQALQTTVNKRQGYINLGCLYGVFSIFSIFGPKVVSLAGPK